MASMHEHQNILENAPHFFKFLLDDNIRGGKLKIPQSFKTKHGKDLSDTVLLRVPSGTDWQVKLTKCDTGVWSLHGLQEFMEYYSLQLGYFLLFRYQGKSNFLVIICDTSATEIEYPVHDSNTCLQQSNSTGEPSKVSQVGTTRSNGVYSEEKHKRKSSSYDGFEDTEDGQRISGPQKPRGASKRSRALQRASSFRSKNPSFMVYMRPSYVCNRFRLILPMSFADKYLLKDRGYFNLHGSNGGPWCVEFIRYNSTSNKNRVVNFTVGWKAFVQDNKLGVGDVCVFELNKGRESSLQVVIYRSCEDTDSHDFKVPKMEHIGDDDDVLDASLPCKKEKTSSSMYGSRDSEHTSEYPLFHRTMYWSCLHGSLTVPRSFAMKYMKRSGPVQLQVEDKSWVVKSRIYEDGSCKLFDFPPFARDNSLRGGDVCVFQLMKSKDMMLKVSIVRYIA